MTTEAYRQDLSRGMDPRDAKDAIAQRVNPQTLTLRTHSSESRGT